MADLVRALVGTGKAATDLLAAVLILIGGLLIMGAIVFQVFVRPEWAFGEALSALWPFLAVGCVCVVLGWIVDRTEFGPPKARERRRLPARGDIIP